MKKLRVVVSLMLCMGFALVLASCDNFSVESSLDSVSGKPGTEVLAVNNTGEDDFAAVVTVNFLDADENIVETKVTEIPYLPAGDSISNIYHYAGGYDSVDYDVETQAVTDKAAKFYDNLTIESSVVSGNTVSFKCGGGNGEAFSGDAVIIYTNDDDKVVDYEIKKIKGKGVVESKFSPCTADCSAYTVYFFPEGLM